MNVYGSGHQTRSYCNIIDAIPIIIKICFFDKLALPSTGVCLGRPRLFLEQWEWCSAVVNSVPSQSRRDAGRIGEPDCPISSSPA